MRVDFMLCFMFILETNKIYNIVTYTTKKQNLDYNKESKKAKINVAICSIISA
jgi:hypothetical protein